MGAGAAAEEAVLPEQLPIIFPAVGGVERAQKLTAGIETAVQRNAGFQAVSLGFFRTLGIKLVRGRLLEPQDRDGAPAVAVVSEEFGRAFLGGDDPIGRRLRRFPAAPSITIVGVVADVRRENRTRPVVAQVYLPAAQTTLYKLIDKNGKVTYSDSPPKNFDGQVIPVDIDTKRNTAIASWPRWKISCIRGSRAEGSMARSRNERRLSFSER